MNNPPKHWLKFFRWFCNPDYLEDIEGDLIERFEKRQEEGKKARTLFARDVLQLFRPGIIKTFEGTKKLNKYGMIKHNLKIGYRNLLRKKVYSSINIGGFALGLAITILISLWVLDELNFDKGNPNYDRVARVVQQMTYNNTVTIGYAMPFPMGGALEGEFGSDFKHVIMSSWFGDYVLSHEETTISTRGGFMDSGAPDMLALEMISGNREALEDQSAVLLSASTAKALFGTADPIDQIVRLYDELSLVVKGVYKDIPHNSSFRRLTFIAPWDLYVSEQAWVQQAKDNNFWNDNSFQLYVELSEGATMEGVSEKIKMIKQNNLSEEDKILNAEVFLHPMKDWHLRSNWEGGVKKDGPIIYVWLFATIGLFVLILACINFMNLSTAQSERRAKEVGIRKSIGSFRSQLIEQFLSESFLVVFISFLIALILVWVAIPEFNQLANKRIEIPFENINFWIISLGFLVVVSLIAGSYPALYLSSFRPVAVLKGTFQTGLAATMFRKIMVVFQFSVSVILLIGTFVVLQQISHTSNRPVGYDKEGTIMIEMSTDQHYKKLDVIKNELKKKKAIVEMAASSSPLTEVWNERDGLSWEGMNPSFTPIFPINWVSFDFGKTVGWELVEGRDFDSNLASDSTTLILNESAVTYMGLEDPVGKSVRWQGKDFLIIGVVKDLLIESPFDPVRQTLFTINKNEMINFMLLRLDPNKSTLASVSEIEETFETHLPNVPFEFNFTSDEHAKKFASINRIGKLAGIFAVLAVIISCLGLFGLASFMAERRTKEIGIRKVLGATIKNLWQLLSKEFVLLILISCMIAIPISYFSLKSWLMNYEYRTELHWWIFVIACLVALVVTLITVSFQSIKAARANPVSSLRSE